MEKPEFNGSGIHTDSENGCHPICSDSVGGCGDLVRGGDKVVYTPNGVLHENCYDAIEC